MKVSIAILLLTVSALSARGAYLPVDASTAAMTPTVAHLFIQNNGLATTTFAESMAAPVQSVNGMTGDVEITTLTLSSLTVSGNATFGADMSVQQNLWADTITETGGGITATIGGITASTLSAQAATFSSLTLSPQRWYAVFVLTPPDRYLLNGALIHRNSSIGATSTISRAQYKDFVLKGAVQTGSSISNRVWDLKFAYISADPGQTVHTQMHANTPDVYYTRSDYETYDPRAWVKQGATAIGAGGSTGWDLGAWVVVVKETGDWFTPYNPQLVWSWIPQDYTGNPPTDPLGRWVWSPVLPAYWTTTPPSF